MKLKLIPLGDRVVAQAVKEKKSPAGIILPTSASKEKPERAVVIAVGKGRMNDDGKIVPLSVKVGDEIVFAKYGPETVSVDGEEYFILREDQILAIIK
jgi:chaperonin GroES